MGAEVAGLGAATVAGGLATERAATATVGVPSKVTLTVRERLTRNAATATPITSTPTARAIQGSRLDGSGPVGGAGAAISRTTEVAGSMPSRGSSKVLA